MTVESDLAQHQSSLDRNAAMHDAIMDRTAKIHRGYKARGLIVSWEICHQEAEAEFDAQSEGPDCDDE